MNSNPTRYYGPCATVFTSGKTGAWRVVRPELDAETCIRCGICEKYCPTGAITVTRTGDAAGLSIEMDYCKGCGICANVCDRNALRMEPEREVL